MDVEGEDFRYAAFTATADSYIVGRKTYDVVKKLTGHFAQVKQYDCYVISRTKSGKEDGVTFYNGDIVALITQLKQNTTKDIYLMVVVKSSNF